MQRRAFVGGLIAAFGLTGPALAEDAVDGIISQLKKQGFQAIVQERTLLGRVRITAIRKDGTREIIINPRTGEILRDLWTPLDGSASTVQIIQAPSGGGGGGGGGTGGDGGGDDGHDDDHGGGGDDHEDHSGDDSGDGGGKD
jgi:hypothetical protein